MDLCVGCGSGRGSERGEEGERGEGGGGESEVEMRQGVKGNFMFMYLGCSAPGPTFGKQVWNTVILPPVGDCKQNNQ